jgi:DNA polymerase III subunit epsilon
MREIVFDTETTGLEPSQGHRLIEIGCIELVNRIPSGNTFHRYLNPERDVPAEAFAIHGLNLEFLKDKPVFASVVDELLEFLADDPLVAHNAMFDLGFLNAELTRATRPVLARDRVVDTLLLARRKHPGSANRLDDLCARYKIDHSRRTKHGALLDAELLAEVYLELIGARQALLSLAEAAPDKVETRGFHTIVRARPQPLKSRLTAEEHATHREFVATLGSNSVWRDYLSAKSPDDSART